MIDGHFAYSYQEKCTHEVIEQLSLDRKGVFSKVRVALIGFGGIDCITNGIDNAENRSEDSALSVKLINTLIESSDKNSEFVEFVTE